MNIRRRLAGVLCALFCGALGLLPAAAGAGVPRRCAPADTEDSGIDVSQWQGEIDFASVRAAGVTVVYIRACEGADAEDPYFERNSAAADAAGLHIGYYHYVTARSAAQARAQAAYFYSLIRGRPADCRPAMDYESFGNLPHAAINAIAAAYLAQLEELCGTKPLLYTDAYRAQNLWDEALADYPLWVADYSSGGSVPASLGPWSTAAALQYTDAGRVNGVTDAVDRDRFRAAVFTANTAPAQRSPAGRGLWYTVRPCDTLWALGRRYGVRAETLAVLNSLADPSLIVVGQVLFIPLCTG